MNELNKHPVILPKREKVSNLIIKQCHIRCTHGGRGATLNKLRSSGYWITSCNVTIRSLLFKCVRFPRLRGRPGEQKIADIHVHRLAGAPPFIYCGVEIFGPFVIKSSGVMFTCMEGRAVHIEIIHSLDSDLFIQQLRRRYCTKVMVTTLLDMQTNLRKHAKKWTMRGFIPSWKVLEET